MPVKARRPDRSVANMGVLKDIRSLLSASSQGPPARPAPQGPDPLVEVAELREQLRQYQEGSLLQQASIDRLEAEKKELEAGLKAIQTASAASSADNRAPPQAVGKLEREISDLEVRKAELSTAISQLEGLAQIKIRDLARRIARIYEEAGDSGASRDFRRISNQLEASGNFGEFLRALLRD